MKQTPWAMHLPPQLPLESAYALKRIHPRDIFRFNPITSISSLHEGRLYIYFKICENRREMLKTKRVQRGISRHFFRVSHLFFFAFRILCQSQHSREKSKIFMVYFFTTLIKHKICKIYEKCIVSVLYFMGCFMKNTSKTRKVYSRHKESSYTKSEYK